MSGFAAAPASSAATSPPRARRRSIWRKRPRAAPWRRPGSHRPRSTSSLSAPPRRIWCFPTAARCCSSAWGVAACRPSASRPPVPGSCTRCRSPTSTYAAAKSGAETLSRITDWSDRSTAVLFADGAGAVVLEPSAAPGVLSTHLHSDGQYKDLLYCAGGVSRGFAARLAIIMAGNEVFKVAVTKLGAAVDEALAANGLERSAVDWLVPHQANIRIIQATARKLDMPMERVIVTVQEHGNTSAASVPLALDVAVRDGRIRRGDLLLLEAFGGGFTWGSALVRY